MTERAPHNRVRFAKLVGEFVLIVAGVTVALAADSLWGVREDHAREAEYLRQLATDVAENERRLHAAIEQEEMQGAAALTALEAILAGAPITADSARAWLIERRAVFYSDPRLLTGTFEALVESGDLRLIQDPALRMELVAYLPQVEADRSEFDRWVGIYLERTTVLRAAGVGHADYDPAIGGTEVLAVLADPTSPVVLDALDAAVLSNQVRLLYLRRMLGATEAMAAALGRGG